jgi:hypothetical protein
LNIALLRVFLERRDEGPRHGSCGLAGDVGVRSVNRTLVSIVLRL